MDRLTKIQDYGVLTIKQGGHADVTIWMRWDESRDDRIEDALLKLAEYEDTGLMPSEIVKLLADEYKQAAQDWIAGEKHHLDICAQLDCANTEKQELKTALKGAKHIADIATARSKDLENSLAESQRREIAAVEDLREHAAFAATCNRYGCGYDCQSPRCPGWQWRGPQEGEPHETV